MNKDKSIGLAEIHTQLKITNRLLIADLKTSVKQNELIALLATTGASEKEIADVLDTTSGTVHTTLQRMKKKRQSTNGKH
jgi:DNA-directed RNA polymerase specialized sigma24 family protein